jgi:hypothetical protein
MKNVPAAKDVQVVCTEMEGFILLSKLGVSLEGHGGISKSSVVLIGISLLYWEREMKEDCLPTIINSYHHDLCE